MPHAFEPHASCRAPARQEVAVERAAQLVRVREEIERHHELMRLQIRGLLFHARQLRRARENDSALLALSALLTTTRFALPSADGLMQRPQVSLLPSALQDVIAEVLAVKAARAAELARILGKRGIDATPEEVQAALRADPGRFAPSQHGRGWWSLAPKEASLTRE